jgi:hypothetical protein
MKWTELQIIFKSPKGNYPLLLKMMGICIFPLHCCTLYFRKDCLRDSIVKGIIDDIINTAVKTAEVDKQKTKYLQHFINKHDTIVSS